MFAVGEKAEWRLQEGSGSAAFPPQAGAPRPPLSAAPPQALEGAPALPSLQTQEPSMGEQAMAFSQAQRAEQLTP